MDKEEDRIDGIEQEMRVELVTEIVQFRFQFFFFEQLLAMTGFDPVLCELDAHRQGHRGEGAEEGVAEEIEDTGLFAPHLRDGGMGHAGADIIARDDEKGGANGSEQGQPRIDAEPAFLQVAGEQKIKIEADRQRLYKNIETR